MPEIYLIRKTARQWGVPPWVVTGDQPTPEVVARWYWRERFFQSAGV